MRFVEDVILPRPFIDVHYFLRLSMNMLDWLVR